MAGARGVVMRADLASEIGTFLNDDDRAAALNCLDGSHTTGRPAADDYDFRGFHCALRHGALPVSSHRGLRRVRGRRS